jgi:hypothetical protein
VCGVYFPPIFPLASDIAFGYRGPHHLIGGVVVIAACVVPLSLVILLIRWFHANRQYLSGQLASELFQFRSIKLAETCVALATIVYVVLGVGAPYERGRSDSETEWILVPIVLLALPNFILLIAFVLLRGAKLTRFGHK